MMLTPDDALQALRSICADFKSFCDSHGKVTEADTRANLIDRIIMEVCGWPQDLIEREPFAHVGHMDYCLSLGGRGRHVCIEAKKEGIPFLLPHSYRHRTLKLSGTLFTDDEV